MSSFKFFIAAALAASLPATALAAQPEGILTLKMTGPRGVTGNVQVYFGAAGTRTEIEMVGGPMPMKMAALMKTGEKGQIYQINDARKLYTVMELGDKKTPADEGKFKVEKIGKEKIAGYGSVHSKITDARGQSFEVWTSKELPINSDVLNSVMRDGGPSSGGFWEALKKEGADGFVVKMESKQGENTFGIELVKAETKSVSKGTFDIPKDYKKVDGMPQLMGMPAGAGGGMPPIPPEAAKALQEKLKNMTPEQRAEFMKQMMQQMQQQQGGGAPKPQ